MPSHVALVAAVALGTCAGMPPGDMTTPQYWGQYFLDKYATERHQAMTLEPGPAPIAQPRTVLLITGVTIPAVWFDPIKARLERDGFRTVVYEPPELLSGDLFENSQKLAAVVDGIRAQTGEERIDILAECTGGLIARQYIQALGGAKHVSRMVTFISPQHGVPKAADAALVANWRALHDLTPGSTFLETVNNAPLPADVPFTSIYSCTDEYIQPFETSKIPGAHNIEVCDGYIGHYRFFYDPELYLIMYGALTAPAPTDPPDQNPATPPDQDPAVDDGDGGGCSTGGGAGAASALIALGLVMRRRRGVRA
jgi:triacylglycerol lipase